VGSADFEVVDRRRIELVEPGMTAARFTTPATVSTSRASPRSWPRYGRRWCGRLAAGLPDRHRRSASLATMGSPWTKDHRVALAATIVSG